MLRLLLRGRDTLRAGRNRPVARPGTEGATVAYLIVAVAVIAWAAGYVVACAIWPFATCRRCTGSGKRRSPSGRAWRKCPRCRGGGERLRFGRRVWNHLTRLNREAR